MSCTNCIAVAAQVRGGGELDEVCHNTVCGCEDGKERLCMCECVCVCNVYMVCVCHVQMRWC